MGQHAASGAGLILTESTYVCENGRKASCRNPSAGEGPLSKSAGGCQTVVSSAIAPEDTWPIPAELTESEITDIIEAYSQSAVRPVRAGAKLVELHVAHG